MNTFKYITTVCLCAGLTFISTNAFSWGKTGHDTVCEIARRHLSAKARKQIDKVLDGKSLVYWANWMDDASHTPEFAYTSTWHYRNVDANETFETATINPKGDVITAVNAQIEALKSGKLDKDQSALALKMLIHFVGDLHCPMHAGHLSDRGGNKWQLQWFGKGTNLHSVWDSFLIESTHRWTYSEWADQIDIRDKKLIAQTAQGTVVDWGKETYELCVRLYETAPVGSNLGYDYIREWTPTLENSLLEGGLRLASILNEIYK